MINSITCVQQQTYPKRLQSNPKSSLNFVRKESIEPSFKGAKAFWASIVAVIGGIYFSVSPNSPGIMHIIGPILFGGGLISLFKMYRKRNP